MDEREDTRGNDSPRDSAASDDETRFTASPLEPKAFAGDQIGPYKLLEVLGEGGMGTVFLAEQLRPIRRQVAVKVIKLGMDTREVIARFESERQALALMTHPNITKVLDAGSTQDGRPYFVMEYVSGVPITEYCDAHRLTTSGRLELFSKVCEALQHAHQKGIIHRDLKPSNVLVEVQNGQPWPRVIDFGIAKATSRELAEKTVFTQHGLLIGTPEYMSPEQGKGELDIDTTTDIYSLGVLLYELLVGALPFDPRILRQAGYAEMQRIISEEDPPSLGERLSKLGARRQEVASRRGTVETALEKELRGDLEWITTRALEKDRTRRYSSASELAADIQRHLDDEPVMASPPSSIYRFKKLLSRNKVTVIGALAVFVVALVGFAVSTSLFWRADEAYQESNRRLLTLYEEQGRQELVEGRPSRAAIYLSSAYQQGLDTPSLRFLLGRAIHPFDSQLASLVGHDKPVSAIAFSVDGSRIITGSHDGTARIWGILDGSLWRTLERHEGGVVWVSFSPDGSRAVTAGADRTVKVWDASSGELLFSKTGYSVGISPLGHRIVITGTSAGQVWDVSSGDLVAKLEVPRAPPPSRVPAPPKETGEIDFITTRIGSSTSPARKPPRQEKPLTDQLGRSVGRVVAMNSDGTRIATVLLNRVQLWDTSNGVELASFTPIRNRGGVEHVAISPDGGRVATIGRQGGSAWIWDSSGGGLVGILDGLPQGTTSAVFGPDGKHLLTSHRSNVAKIWKLSGMELLVSLDGHLDSVSTAAFSPDGNRVVTASQDRTAKIWNVSQGLLLASLEGHAGPINSVVFSGDGTRILTGGADRTARVWEVSNAAKLIAFESYPAPSLHGGVESYTSPTSVSPDGTRVVTRDRNWRAQVWDARDGDRLFTLKGHSGDVNSAAFSPDGAQIVTASDDHTARIWDGHDGSHLLTLDDHRGQVHSASFSTDRSRVLTTSWDTTAKVWEASGGRLLSSLVGHRASVDRGTFSPDGSRVLTGSFDTRYAGPGRWRLWETETGKQLASAKSHVSRVFSIAFSPNGDQLVTTGEDGTARIWDSTDGKELGSFPHPPDVTCAGFSPDGTLLITGGSDRTARLWNTTTQELLFSMVGHEDRLYSAVFSPDGSLVLSASEDRTAGVWDARSGRLLTALEGHKGAVRRAAFSQDGQRVLTSSIDGFAILWDIHSETRSRGEITQVVESRVPWRLEEGQLIPGGLGR